MKKVLVTGANGYIGRHVVKRLLDMGYEVDACDIRFDEIDTRANKIQIPIFSGNSEIYNELGRPDICIHLAWRDGFIHNSNAHMEDLSKHYIFIKNMIDGGLENISIMGTMHEVGYWEGAIDENSATNPLSMYGIAKNALRQAVELYINDKNISFKWLRAYYILGDDLKSNSIFSKIVKMERDGQAKFPFTTGKNKYDFIEIDELVNQIAIASLQNEVTGIINCCSGEPISLAEKVEEFIRQNNFKIKLEYGAYPDRPYDSPGVWGDNKKIKYILQKYSD
ncbi:NAD-dependent epimerase/dehydratase family protein [Clostridium baratii]|uniref:NAD-dependent epimerase/dehydratase family protein n=1 Tax=Clostridium baratii TaxID=1561 RepID=UPI0030D2DD85